ncbi:hypothetical protein EPUS_03846 [Endocarpon pusillum Z07020]|uniref:Uncharacterized protein n=1 Tax=Endocarpon pusillum (strain Z07020 / HMAS-L-300199) TaxID=1263415 RepID=U1GPY2_ENDPU|nr:uncharacterized protein EPUS_03846 [Endocarpon pusillum Z07020]ERF74031.1 hypothetical protein EPUS_03846 [Endocarpon pusillum Z07020]
MGCGTSKSPHAPQRQKREAARSSRLFSTAAEQRAAGRPTPSTVQSPAEVRSTRRARLASPELVERQASSNTPRTASLIVEHGSSSRSSPAAVPSPAEARTTGRSRLAGSEPPAQRASSEPQRSASLLVQQGSSNLLPVPNIHAIAKRGSSPLSSTSSPTVPEAELEPRNLFATSERKGTEKPQAPGSAMAQEVDLRPRLP